MNTILLWCLPWVVTFVIAVCTVSRLIKHAEYWGLVDTANERSMHSGSKPRSGGLGILLAVACGWLLSGLLGYPPTRWVAISLAAMAVAGISLLDDLRDISQWPRFAIHLLAAATCIIAGFGLDTLALPGVEIVLGKFFGAALTLAFVVWFINLYNFMDGMDGFAGGMTLLGFGFLALLGAIDGDVAFALASGVIAAAAGGFLLFNFPPASVFMGDAGSATLGFLAAATILWADAEDIAPIWVGVMIFAPFFLDASVTVILRLWRRERLWEAHRTHYYQRIVQAGWSHRQAALLEYVLMLGCGGCAVIILDEPVLTQWMVILSWLVIFLGCAWLVRSLEGVKSDVSSAG